MSVPIARQDPHLRRYPLRRRVIHVAGGPLRLVVPASSHALLVRSTALARRAAAGQLPHWADVWPASVALARRIARSPSLDGLRAVDLGCGLGVAGLAAGRKGAQVRFLDSDECALRFAAFNADAIGLSDFECEVFDWADERLPCEADLLLLADVLYAWRHGSSLLRHAERVLERGGRVLCADPFRPTAEDFLAEFVARWSPRVSEEHVTIVDDANGDRVAVRILDVATAG